MRFLLILLFLFSLNFLATAQQDSIEVKIDPRIELMGVIQLLADYPIMTPHHSPYRKDVRIYFSELKEHTAVRLFPEMYPKGFAFDVVPKAMLSFTSPPELSQRVPYPERIVTEAGGKDSLRKFVDALRGFARESDFQAFFDAHRGTYQAIVDSARGPVNEAVRTLRDYVGSPLSNSVVILGPLLHHGGFAALYELEDKLEAYALVGPATVENGLPAFGSSENLSNTTYHEFSHTVVNPLTRKHWDQLKSYDHLLDPIAEQMEKAAYGSWKTVVDEHIIRAIEVRLMY